MRPVEGWQLPAAGHVAVCQLARLHPHDGFPCRHQRRHAGLHHRAPLGHLVFRRLRCLRHGRGGHALHLGFYPIMFAMHEIGHVDRRHPDGRGCVHVVAVASDTQVEVLHLFALQAHLDAVDVKHLGRRRARRLAAHELRTGLPCPDRRAPAPTNVAAAQPSPPRRSRDRKRPNAAATRRPARAGRPAALTAGSPGPRQRDAYRADRFRWPRSGPQRAIVRGVAQGELGCQRL